MCSEQRNKIGNEPRTISDWLCQLKLQKKHKHRGQKERIHREQIVEKRKYTHHINTHIRIYVQTFIYIHM